MTKPRVAVFCPTSREAKRVASAAAGAGCSPRLVSDAGELLEAGCEAAVLVANGDDQVFELARELRARRASSLVLVALPGAKQAGTLRAFECGADDVVAWPLPPALLQARLRAMLRRLLPAAPAAAPAAPARPRLDEHGLALLVDGRSIPLTSSEAKLMASFLKHPGRTVARADLLAALWDTHERVRTRSVDVHVANLRRKLGPTSCRILASRPVGYRFIPA